MERDRAIQPEINDRLAQQGGFDGHDAVLGVQAILDATKAFDAESRDALDNRRVHSSGFSGLASRFDAARARSPGLSSWALTNALLAFHLSGTDDAALGGELDWHQRKNAGGSVSGPYSAHQFIGASELGLEQMLRPFSGLGEGLAHLS
jgi:hypothetical protein